MKENYGPDGCAIFYRKNVFQIRNMSCEKIVAPGEQSTYDSQIFIIAEFKHLASGKHVTIVSIHLKSKAENYEKRANQIEYILKVVSKHVHESLRSSELIDKHSVIMCGDFNGEPFEKFYSTIVEMPLFGFRDAYSQETKQPTTIKYRANHDGLLKRAIDYVFYRPACLEVTEFLDLPVENHIVNEQGLPNLLYSSDHLALACGFRFRSKKL